ncbi:MAG: Fic family protein [Methanomassiliicoccaceae archaeon]|jgi:Fic family protein|nr:Fic family protein [Methanomassiliicoccaceae archaeon]
MKRPKNAPETRDLLKNIDLSKIDVNAHLEAAIKYNSDYSHWDRVRYRTKEGLDPKIVWALMKLMRENCQHIRIGDMKMKYSLIEEFQKAIHDIDIKAPTSILSRNGLDGKEMKIYAISSVMEESIASSQIEGAATTTQVAKKMLRENRRPQNGSEQMIVNNYNAMRLIKNLKDRDLTQELIFDVHREITKNTIEDRTYEGRYRDTDNIVISDRYTGEVFHEPIRSEKIDGTMRALCDYVNDEKVFVHPLIKGIMIHYLIGYIHPFVDGNGRTARSLFYWYLLKKGYWVIEFMSLSKAIKNDRQNYDLSYLLSETDENDMTYFIKFNLSKMEEALDDFIGYVENKRKEQHEFELKISDDLRLPMRQRMIIMRAIRSGAAFSIYEIQSKYQVTYQTARADIMRLEELGLIEKVGKQSNQVLYSIKNSGRKSDEGSKEKKNAAPPEKVRRLDNFFG